MKLTVSGYYGFGNTGDEAILAGMKRSFQLLSNDDVSLIVLSGDPAATGRAHAVDSVPRRNLPAVARSIRSSSLLISGGGSLFQDATSVRSLLYYAAVPLLAARLGKPVMLYAQGVGPVRRRLSRAVLRSVARNSTAITVRDPESRRLLEGIGVARPIEVTADPAFALTRADGAPDMERRSGLRAVDGGPTVGLAFRPWSNGQMAAAQRAARLVAALQRRHGVRVVFVPMHASKDARFASFVDRLSGGGHEVAQPAKGVNYIIDRIASLDAMVGMRLHALVFAVISAVPLFAISYDPKVDSLMCSLGLDDAIAAWSTYDPDDVADRTADLLMSKETRSARLRALLPPLHRRALRNAEIALELARRSA